MSINGSGGITITDPALSHRDIDVQDGATVTDEKTRSTSMETFVTTEVSPRLCLSVVGAGNTGSMAVMLASRIEKVAELRLFDPDAYEQRNMFGQGMPRGRSVGRAKAEELRSEAQRIRPGLKVISKVDRVENVPPGQVFRQVAAVLCNVDNRATRRYLCEQAWRYGVPLIDCGVDGGEWFVRVAVYMPRPDLACFQCGVDPAAEAFLEQTYPCVAEGGDAVPATNAAAWLGALAAGLQLAELEKMVGAREGRCLAGEELLLNVRMQTHRVSKLTRSRMCAFSHRQWGIEVVPCSPGSLTVARAFALGLPPAIPVGPGIGNLPRFVRGRELALEVPTKQFVTRMQCAACGHERALLRLRHRLREHDLRCAEQGCGGEMVVVPDRIRDRLYSPEMTRELSKSMRALGFERGDLFSIVDPDGEARHFELAVDRDGQGGTPPGIA